MITSQRPLTGKQIDSASYGIVTVIERICQCVEDRVKRYDCKQGEESGIEDSENDILFSHLLLMLDFLKIYTGNICHNGFLPSLEQTLVASFFGDVVSYYDKGHGYHSLKDTGGST